METERVARLRVERLFAKGSTARIGKKSVVEFTTIQTDLVLELNDVEPTGDRPHAET